MLQNRGAMYYYITNLQGDVIRLVNSSGQTAAYYEYDPYGNAIKAAGSHCEINPLRYRGYVYDTETGLYYCQSRYYDPAIGRFINADEYSSTGQGIIGNNMFAYCNNNPIAGADHSGKIAWFTVANAAIGAVVGAATQITVNILTGNTQLNGEKSVFKGVAGAALGGAAYNVVSLLTGNLVAASAAGSAAEALTNEVGAYIKGDKKLSAKSLASSVANTVTTTVENSMTAAITGKIASRIVKTNAGWFKPKKIVSSFTGKYARKIWGQTATQGTMTAAVNTARYYSKQNLLK